MVSPWRGGGGHVMVYVMAWRCMVWHMVLPSGHGMVYGMAWWAWHDIWYGLAGITWYKVWSGET